MISQIFFCHSLTIKIPFLLNSSHTKFDLNLDPFDKSLSILTNLKMGTNKLSQTPKTLAHANSLSYLIKTYINKNNSYTIQPRLLQPFGSAKIVAISSGCYLLLVVIEALQKSRLLQWSRLECNSKKAFLWQLGLY